MEYLFKIRVRTGRNICSKEGRKRGQKICVKGDRNGEGYIYKFDKRLGLVGYEEWKSDTRSLACSSSMAGSQEYSSSVFS